MDCPVCQSNHFYIKDPADEFEIYEVTCQDGKIHYNEEEEETEAPKISENPEVYCQRCAWHGKVS